MKLVQGDLDAAIKKIKKKGSSMMWPLGNRWVIGGQEHSKGNLLSLLGDVEDHGVCVQIRQSSSRGFNYNLFLWPSGVFLLQTLFHRSIRVSEGRVLLVLCLIHHTTPNPQPCAAVQVPRARRA